MAQRNLTPQFKAFRDGFSARRQPRRRRMNENTHDQVEEGIVKDDNILPKHYEAQSSSENPLWIEAVEDTKKKMMNIQSKIRLLNQQHKNRLLVRFDNSEVTKDKEIDLLTNEITELFHLAEKKIKQDLGMKSNSFINKTNADYVVKENIKRQLAQELQQLSVAFRKSQKEYMERLRSQKGGGTGMEDILGLSRSTADPSRANQSDQDSLLLESFESTHIQERDKEIQKIAENITELATIFQDLATLVIDQGTLLDRIDYNLENVQVRTEKGLEELIAADRYSKNSRPFQCIMILLGIIVLEALTLLLKAK